MKLKSFLLLALVMTSCASGPDVSEFAFKESRGDRWGLVSPSGKVLIADEFSERPSPVVNGIFTVPCEKGCMMYSKDDPTKPIGDVYRSVACFLEKYTPSVKKDESIKYIDKKGNVVFELPSNYVGASSFLYGYSNVARVDKKSGNTNSGVIDMDFNEFFPKRYDILKVLKNGTFVVKKKESNNFYIIDKEENEIVKLSSFRYYGYQDYCINDKMYTYNDDDRNVGVKTFEGEVIIRPKYETIYLFDNEIIVEGEDGWGILDKKGENIISPKYSRINGVSNGKFIAIRDGEYGLLNFNEDRLLKFDYDDLDFIINSDNLVAQKDGESSTIIINEKGEVIFDCYDVRPFSNIEDLIERYGFVYNYSYDYSDGIDGETSGPYDY